MASIVTNLTCELTTPVSVVFLPGNMFSMDNGGNIINVFVVQNGEPATLGGSVSANVIRSDGTTVAITGALEGNKAYIILPQACYAVPGIIHIVMKITQGTTITTIAAITANVYQSSTDAIVDPGQLVPSVAALIEAIEEAVDSIPVDYSGLLATLAADYSTSKTYKVGDYAWYGGVLKRCIVAITTAESYTAAHWTNAVIGDDLSALKSAITFEQFAHNALVNGKFNLAALWRRGSRSSSTSVSNYQYRITTEEMVGVLAETKLQISAGFRYNLYKYVKATGEYDSASGWKAQTDPITLDPAYLYHINIARTAQNESTSEIADIPTFASKLYASTIDTTLEKAGVAADSKATGDAIAEVDGKRLGQYCEMVTIRRINIDTVNKTISGGTITIKCGSYVKNNPTIDISDLDTSAYQTFYYDFDDDTIKVVAYTSYKNLENVRNTAYLGSVYAANTTYPNGYFQLNTNGDIYVNGIKQANNVIPNKEIHFFGDSICAGRTDGGADDEPATYTDYKINTLFQEEIGLVAANNAVSGKMWQKYYNTGDIGWQIAQTGALDCDYVLFFCGTNDYAHNTPIGAITDAPAFVSGGSFYAALHYAIQYVFTQKPAMEIFLVTPAFRNYYGSNANKIGNAYTTVTNGSGYTLGDYCDAIVAIGKYYNIPVLDMRENCPFNIANIASLVTEVGTGISGRYLHPKNETYLTLNNRILNWFKGVSSLVT